jgi:hypothetical protein
MEDLLRLAVLVALAEESQGRPAEVRAPTKTTKVVKEGDVQIPDTVLYEEGSGTLTELVVVSDRKEFALTAYADGVLLIEGDFTDLQLISPRSEWVDAYEEDGAYVVRISNVNFRESVKIDVRPTAEPFKLKQVFARLDLTSF